MICNKNFQGSHLCTTDDIMNIIATQNLTEAFKDVNGTSAWVAEGPPGYVTKANDCVGFKDNTSNALGAYWYFLIEGGGEGWLTFCNSEAPLACCK